MRKIKRGAIILALAALAAFSAVPTAFADPLTCNGSHDTFHVPGKDGWSCENNPQQGNPNTEDFRNPNK